MKACPYCAEEIQEAAIKCRHCKADITPMKPVHTSEPVLNASVSLPAKKSTLKTLGKVALAIIFGPIVIGFGIALWQVSIPALLVLLLRKKTKLNLRLQYAIGAAVLIICLGLTLWMSKHTPTLDITSPKDNTSLAAQSIALQGKIKPPGSTLTINGQSAPLEQDGTFNNEIPLKQGENRLEIAVRHNGFSSSQVLTITRTLTPEEEKIIADQKAKEEADKKAEELAWQKSKAGQLCKKHQDWNRAACDRVADNLYWIGMSYDMLVAERGRANRINPSNYGGGVKYQYCWDDYTPSCFYDDNNDDLLDSYN